MTHRRVKKREKTLRFMPLGGVEDINRNCYVVEYGKDIVIMDMGLSFPGDDLLGVNYVIPDVDYLVKRKDRIRGIFLTHAHLDHVGAIPYVIEDLGFPPVYGREFTILFLKEKLKEFGLDKRVKLNIVKPKEDLLVGSVAVRFVHVTHAIPQSSSIQVKTPAGSVVYTGDYKFDESPVRDPKPDYEEFERIGKEGVVLACMDSTNVYESGKSRSEADVAEILDGIVRKARGRVIAATFSSLGSRLYSLIEIAKKYDRKVVITGRSMKTMINLMRKIRYVEVSDDILLSDKQIKGIPDEKLLILTTGSQGEEMAALSRMSRGEHRGIRIKETDTVILSSSVIPGNQVPVQHLIDDLLRLGARVIHQSFMNVHTSGHGYQDDMRRMYKMLQPRFAMPVHGWRSFVQEAMYLLKKWGMDKSNILRPETGQRFEFDERAGKWFRERKFTCRNIYVDGVMVGETGERVLRERSMMAEGGVMLIVIRRVKGGVMKGLTIESKGLMKEGSKRRLLDEIKSNVRGIVTKHRGDKPGQVRNSVRRSVERIIERRIGKNPLVLVELV